MGYPRALRYACAFAAIAGLTGCNPSARKTDIDDVRAEMSALAVRVDDLEAQVSDLEGQLADTRKAGIETAVRAHNLGVTVNSNARIANENALREMTRRGACGTEVVPIYASDGSGRQVGIQNNVIPCTLKDLRP